MFIHPPACSRARRVLTLPPCTSCRQQPDSEFVQSVLQHAVRVNDWKREDAAAKRVLAAWSELVCLVVSKRFVALRAALEEAPGALSAVLVVLLFAALKLVPAADDARCTQLLRVVHALLERLQPGVDGHDFASAGPGNALPPSSCHDILHALLLAMLRSDRSDTTRHSAYAALLSYMRLCRPPHWTHSPAVLRLVQRVSAPYLPDVGGNLRAELDAGNLVELRRHGSALVSVMARDALGGWEQGRMQVLAAVEALLGVAEGSGAALETPLLLGGLPAAVAMMLERTPRSVLLLPPPACSRALSSMEAQLSFLLSVARYTPSGASQLVACGAVVHLAGCQVIDALPEESSEPHERVQQAVLLPALQLVSALVQLLPDSTELTAQAVKFATAHHDALLRLLGARDREAHALQAAQVCVQLLCRLCIREAGPALARFREALERMCWRFFDADALARHGVQAQHTSEVFLIQAVLASYLRRLVVSRRAMLPLSGSRDDSSGRSGVPTLQLVASLVKRLTSALGDLLRSRHELLGSLTDNMAARGSESMLLDAGGERRGQAAAAANLARVDSDARTVLLALENALEAVHATLVAEITAGLTVRDAEALRFDLVPVLDDLARLQDEDCGRDLSFLRLLLRRVPQLIEEGSSGNRRAAY